MDGSAINETARIGLMQEEKVLKVSVCVVTYNQEKYIRQCLQSIVNQETDFDFEVIVADDCSTDGTRAIVQEFVGRYPEVVKPIFHEKNIGAYKNFVFVHQQPIGKYIAHMDGDDYCLPGKLQAQATYLDANPHCSIVWHRVKILNLSNNQIYDDFNIKTNIDGLKFFRKDILLIGSIGCHSSKMYRSNKEPIRYTGQEVLDFYTDVEQIGRGYATILDGRYGVYRRGVGIASGTKTLEIYLSHLEIFSMKYPEHRYEIAANAFVIFLAGIKNKRKIWFDALKIWIKVNPFYMTICLIKLIPIILNFRASKKWK